MNEFHDFGYIVMNSSVLVTIALVAGKVLENNSHSLRVLSAYLVAN